MWTDCIYHLQINCFLRESISGMVMDDDSVACRLKFEVGDEVYAMYIFPFITDIISPCGSGNCVYADVVECDVGIAVVVTIFFNAVSTTSDIPNHILKGVVVRREGKSATAIIIGTCHVQSLTHVTGCVPSKIDGHRPGTHGMGIYHSAEIGAGG